MPLSLENPVEAELHAWLTQLRWPTGPICPRCRRPAATPKRSPGFYRCRTAGCRRPFTLTVGTVLERTHHPLIVWWKAVNHLTAAENGLTIRQLQQLLMLPYRSTWSMIERLRKVAPKQHGPFTLAPLTAEEVFTRLMARPYVLPQERFERLERQARRIEALAERAARKSTNR